MSSTRGIALGLLLAGPLLLAQTVAQTPAPSAPRHRHKSHKAQKQLALPPLPSGPLRQLPMDQIPATPAKVSYQDGLLTISAQNSNLGDILRDVHQLTGASIEIPQGSGANQRVITHLGPGAPRDVLAGLLNGTSFNYVMVGSNSDPGAVATVVLTARPSATGEAQPAANVYPNNPTATMPQNRFPGPQPFNQPVIVPQPGNGQAASQPVAAEPDDSKDDDQENADDSEDQTQGQPPQPEANTVNPQDQPQPDANQPNAGPKTPEQILEMLRRNQNPGGAVIPQPQPPQ